MQQTLSPGIIFVWLPHILPGGYEAEFHCQLPKIWMHHLSDPMTDPSSTYTLPTIQFWVQNTTYLSTAHLQKHCIQNYGPKYSLYTDNGASVIHTLLRVAILQQSPLISHCLNVIFLTLTITWMQSCIMSVLAGRANFYWPKCLMPQSKWPLHCYNYIHSMGPVPAAQHIPTAPNTCNVSPTPTIIDKSWCSNPNPPELPPIVLDWCTNCYKHEHDCIPSSPHYNILSMEEDAEHLVLLPILYWYLVLLHQG